METDVLNDMTGAQATAPSSVDDYAKRPLRRPVPASEPRTEAQLREHYCVERGLAERLRRASRDERRELYSVVYDEMYQRVPHHPMMRDKRSAVARDVEPDLRFLRRFLRPGAVFMEIGAGDCTLSRRIASLVRLVYAVDVSEEITRGTRFPANFRLCLSDGTSIPVPEGSVHVAYSDQLMEHLHPEDAVRQLHNIYRALTPGGVYVCITPNRLYGPSDISCYFDETSTGFHLREYSALELHRLFKSAGFANTRSYAGARGWYVRWPLSVSAGLEWGLDALPYRVRRPLAGIKPLRALLGVRMAAVKPFERVRPTRRKETRSRE
jgi:SAM-dependent methyltransferase